jgi:hypothetical protein
MALQVRRRQQRNRGGAISVVDGYLQGEAT